MYSSSATQKVKGGRISSLPPLFLSPVCAGFPSPAESYCEKALDLNELLVRHPAATFFVRAEGDSMREAGISPGDILVVDRSLEARDGSIVVALLDGEFTVKYFQILDSKVRLIPANPKICDIEVPEEANFAIWGVVTAVIRRI